jgi:hypothetical protein
MTGDIPERPALVVKVENSIDARPQEGLDSADIVFEEMVEGGISRYVALFHSTIPYHIVPVRSIRPMDGPIAGWTHGVMVYAGGQAPFEERAQADGLQLISGGEGLGRTDDRYAPHNLAANPEKLLTRADGDHLAAPPQFASFVTADSTAQTVGAPAGTLSVTISPIATPEWAWDANAGAWMRWEDGDPAVVVDGTQLSATNVLALSVDVTMLDFTDAAGSHVPETIVVGSGSGVVMSGGASAPITWQKDSETAPWQFFDATGAPLKLLAGNTWVELVPAGSGSWTVS